MFSSLSKSTKPSTEFFCIIFISLCKLPNYARAAKSLRKRISLRPAGQIQGILNRETHFSQTRQVNSNFFMIKKYTSNHCFTFFSHYCIAQITFQNMLIPYANLLRKSTHTHTHKKKKKKKKKHNKHTQKKKVTGHASRKMNTFPEARHHKLRAPILINKKILSEHNTQMSEHKLKCNSIPE